MKDHINKAALWLIRVYQYAISPLFPPRCRYFPTCSEYAHQAISGYGITRGGILALKRVCRCHPYQNLGGGSGIDPVPNK